MEYQKALSRKHDENDVIALYYDGTHVTYECVHIGDRQDIGRLVPDSDGQAFGYEEKGRRYWVLPGKGRLLMWKKTGSLPPYGDISSDKQDHQLFRYLMGML